MIDEASNRRFTVPKGRNKRDDVAALAEDEISAIEAEASRAASKSTKSSGRSGGDSESSDEEDGGRNHK